MTETILGMSVSAYKRTIKRAVLFLSALAIICIAVNVALIVCVTDETKTLFAAVNILSDIVVFSFCYGFFMSVLKDKIRYLRLYLKKDGFAQTTTGRILSVEGRERIEKIDCRRVVVDEDGKERVLYLPDCELAENLPSGKAATFITVNNIVAEVIYES